MSRHLRALAAAVLAGVVAATVPVAVDAEAVARAKAGFQPQSASVPAMCGLPAGRLAQGRHVASTAEVVVKLGGEVTRSPGPFGDRGRRHHLLTLVCVGDHRVADNLVPYPRAGRPERTVDLGSALPLRDPGGLQAPLARRATHAGDRFRVRVRVVSVATSWESAVPSGG